MGIEKLGTNPSILLIITDQQRALQHWPKQWELDNLPSMDRLRRHGLDFSQAFTAAAACSSSRGSLLTGTYPSQHGIFNTLQMPDDTISSPSGSVSLQRLRPTDLNIARILSAAGYQHPTWKGKWHISLPVDGGSEWTEADEVYMREAYGFHHWNPNDAGNSETDVTSLGAGTKYHNDERYISGVDESDSSPSGTGAVEFLTRQKPGGDPFFLVVSLVNPHDIWVAPNFSTDSGYSLNPDGCAFDLPVPVSVDEDLSDKPSVQAYFKKFMSLSDTNQLDDPQNEDHPNGPTYENAYVNFYAYLQTVVDKQVTAVLDALDETGLTDETLVIRTSDHGEMGLSHGLREKDFQAYDETIRVPLIFSNPVAFPEPLETDTPVSLVDIAPTLSSLTGVFEQFAYSFKGVDLMPVLRDPTNSVRTSVHFTTDDNAAPVPADMPHFIRAIRNPEWMYAVYFTDDVSSFEFEMYNLVDDPNQLVNLAGKQKFEDKQGALHQQLQDSMLENGTVPSQVLLQTQALQSELDDVSMPLWPSPEQAAGQSSWPSDSD